MIRIIIESLLEIIIKIVIEISPGRAMGPLGQDNGTAGTGQWAPPCGGLKIYQNRCKSIKICGNLKKTKKKQ